MKKVKLILVLIILAVVVIFAFQNQVYFKETRQLSLDLIVAGPYVTPVINNATICAAFFMLGVVITYLLTLTGRIKQRKSIKVLNNNIGERQKEIITLKSELETQKSSPPPEMMPSNEISEEVVKPPEEREMA